MSNISASMTNTEDKKFQVIVATSSIITLLLYVIPFFHVLSLPFLWLSTLFHEMYHGIAAVIFGGHFTSFRMFADGSGVAEIHGDFGRVSKAMIAMAGLIAPAITAAVFFKASQTRKKSRALLSILGILLCISLLLVRNLFAILFLVFVITACFFFSLGKGKNMAQNVLAWKL